MRGCRNTSAEHEWRHRREGELLDAGRRGLRDCRRSSNLRLHVVESASDASSNDAGSCRRRRWCCLRIDEDEAAGGAAVAIEVGEKRASWFR